MATKAQKQTYAARVAAALVGMDLKGLFPSVIIAQAGLESGWGLSGLAKNYNNHFGMKKGGGTNFGGWGGETVLLPTKEYVGGQYITVNSLFRVYPSLQASIIDHNGLFYKLSRYKDVCKATSPLEQITAIKNGGYATGPKYVSSVMSIIEELNLTQYDNMTGSGSGSGSGGETVPTSTSTTLKQYKMNTKTLSLIIVAAGLALAALGGYNLLF